MTTEQNEPIEPTPADDASNPPTTSEPARLSLLAAVGIWMVRQYQWWCRPWMGDHCRFYPSCSDYMILAVKKHGFLLGVPKGIWRICRCQPFHPGGVDYP